ncbi:MAG: NTP transferase domain-containing protein [Patescibacteria group bacterium]
MEKIAAVILAAGKGTRMNEGNASPIPKVMFEINKIPMIRYSVDNVKKAGISNIVVVVGYKKELIENYLDSEVEYAIQEEQKGTGHAAMAAEEILQSKTESLLICYGDMPLFKPETIRNLIDVYENPPAGGKPTIAMLSVKLKDPVSWAYGRIIRNSAGEVESIVEQKDCTEEQLKIKESNPGFYIFDAGWFWNNCHKLTSKNIQGEYYLTDMIGIAKEQGKKIVAIPVSDESEALGINNPEQLKIAEELLSGPNKS